MLTQHGPRCDTCKKYILPLGGKMSSFEIFTVKLCAHEGDCTQQLADKLNNLTAMIQAERSRNSIEGLLRPISEFPGLTEKVIAELGAIVN